MPSRSIARLLALAGLAALALAAPATAAGQARSGMPWADAPDARVVTFDDAVQRALRLGTDILRARAQVDLAGSLETREWMAFVPRLSLSTGARRSFGRSFSPEEGAILSETTDAVDGAVSANFTLFDGMRRLSAVRQASLQEDASRLRLDRTRQDVLFALVEGYIGLLQARELRVVREQELTAGSELLEQVRRLVDLGRAPVSDLYQQQAAYAEAEAALVEGVRQVEVAETALLQVLQLDPFGSYRFDVPDLPEDDGTEREFDLALLMERAFASRGDLVASERALKAAEEGLDAAQAGYWPSLALSFNYGSNWNERSRQPVPGSGVAPETVTFTPEGRSEPVTFEVPGTGSGPRFYQPGFMEQLDSRRGGSVSLSLSVPVFDGLQTRTQVQQAEVQRLNARYDLQDQQQLIAVQVRQALVDFRSARAQREATRRRLEAAERAWEAAERRYELGAATFVEVVQARSGLVAARSAAIRARYGVLLAERRIDYHTGTLEPGALLPRTVQES